MKRSVSAVELNVAVTVRDADIVTEHPPVPVHAPDHPATFPEAEYLKAISLQLDS